MYLCVCFYNNNFGNTSFILVQVTIVKIHTRELFRESKTLNVYEFNILNNLVFMHKIKSRTAPKVFQNKFRKSNYK